MPLSDHEYVNFSQEHELNYHLEKVKKPKSISNRQMLKIMGNELKTKLDKTYLTHSEFDTYVRSQLSRLS